jgi:hypothetical protein
MKQASISSTDQGGGKLRAGGIGVENSAINIEAPVSLSKARVKAEAPQQSVSCLWALDSAA